MNLILPTISAILFYLLPTLVGVVCLPKKLITQTSPLFALCFSFCLGVMILYASLLAFGVTLLTAQPILIGMTIFLCIVSFYRFRVKNILQYIPYIVALGILTAITYALWRINSPLPSPLNWDIHEHQLLATIIQNGTLSIRTSALSDTFLFNGYTTQFHSLLAIAQSILKPDSATFWWIIESIHLFTTICASWVLGWAATGNKTVGMLSAILGALIFESAVAFSSLFLIPQTLTAVMGTLTIAYILYQQRNQATIQPMLIAISCTSMILMHFIIGGAWIGLITMFFIALKLPSLTHRIISSAVIVPIIALVVCVVGYITTLVNPATFVFGQAKMFTYTFLQHMTFFQSFYSYSLLLLYPIGIFEAYKHGTMTMKLISIISLLLFVIILSPLPYVLKFYVVNRYLVHLIMAYGIWYSLKYAHIVTRILSYSFISIALLCVFCLNIFQWKEQTEIDGVATHVSSDEQSASRFLARQPDRVNSLLISDPATQYILENMSGINSQGGAYMNATSRNGLNTLLNATNQNDFAKAIFTIRDTVTSVKPTTSYIVISGRTVEWNTLSVQDKLNLGINIWNPVAFSLRTITTITTWEEMHTIRPIFTNTSVRIYKYSI